MHYECDDSPKYILFYWVELHMHLLFSCVYIYMCVFPYSQQFAMILHSDYCFHSNIVVCVFYWNSAEISPDFLDWELTCKWNRPIDTLLNVSNECLPIVVARCTSLSSTIIIYTRNSISIKKILIKLFYILCTPYMPWSLRNKDIKIKTWKRQKITFSVNLCEFQSQWKVQKRNGTIPGSW